MLKKNKSEKFVCPVCGCEEYDIKNNGSVYKDENGKVIGKCDYYVPTCRNCGQPVHMEYVDKANRKAEAEFERNKWPDMLTADQIKSLPRRYNLSRDEFLRVMHISNVHDKDGENNWETFDIWDGDLPSNDEEERLEKVYHDPKAWMDILEANKNLVTKETYERSMERAKTLKEQ